MKDRILHWKRKCLEVGARGTANRVILAHSRGVSVMASGISGKRCCLCCQRPAVPASPGDSVTPETSISAQGPSLFSLWALLSSSTLE